MKRGGGFTLHSDNQIVDTALSFVPFYGSAMDWEDAIKDPSFTNYMWAGLGTVADLVGGSLIKGGIKTYKAVQAYRKYEKAMEAANAALKGAERASKAGKSKKAAKLYRDNLTIRERNPKPNPYDIPDFDYKGVRSAIDYSPFIQGLGIQPAINGLQGLTNYMIEEDKK